MTSPLPAVPVEASPWDQALYAFLVEKGNRSGSKRTVESYSRMLWHFFKNTTPDRVTPAVGDDDHLRLIDYDGMFVPALPIGRVRRASCSPRTSAPGPRSPRW
jgi:hypothetical protein